uniref:Uncharacterized protein n=1 Tax=Sphaerodactylus townsendi TaxID=933632 RepID=A0ACB8F422_9SAUR
METGNNSHDLWNAKSSNGVVIRASDYDLKTLAHSTRAKSSTPGKDVEMNCGYPGSIRFGSFELINEDDFVFGARVVYECDPGISDACAFQINYEIVKPDGWSYDVPHCEASKGNPCGYPEAENLELYRKYEGYMDHRHHYFPKREGEHILFHCKNGSLPLKSERYWVYSRCTKSGWDPEPKCFKLCEHTGGFPHGSFNYDNGSYEEGDEVIRCLNPIVSRQH